MTQPHAHTQASCNTLRLTPALCRRRIQRVTAAAGRRPTFGNFTFLRTVLTIREIRLFLERTLAIIVAAILLIVTVVMDVGIRHGAMIMLCEASATFPLRYNAVAIFNPILGRRHATLILLETIELLLSTLGCTAAKAFIRMTTVQVVVASVSRGIVVAGAIVSTSVVAFGSVVFRITATVTPISAATLHFRLRPPAIVVSGIIIGAKAIVSFLIATRGSTIQVGRAIVVTVIIICAEAIVSFQIEPRGSTVEVVWAVVVLAAIWRTVKSATSRLTQRRRRAILDLGTALRLSRSTLV